MSISYLLDLLLLCFFFFCLFVCLFLRCECCIIKSSFLVRATVRMSNLHTFYICYTDTTNPASQQKSEVKREIPKATATATTTTVTMRRAHGQ